MTNLRILSPKQHLLLPLVGTQTNLADAAALAIHSYSPVPHQM